MPGHWRSPGCQRSASNANCKHMRSRVPRNVPPGGARQGRRLAVPHARTLSKTAPQEPPHKHRLPWSLRTPVLSQGVRSAAGPQVARGAPVATCAQFCISITSARSATATSTDDRKSPAPSPSPAAPASAVARPSGDATMMSDWKNSANSRTDPLRRAAHPQRLRRAARGAWASARGARPGAAQPGAIM